MTDPVFQKAYDTVRKTYNGEAWGALTPREITEAIYREIRRIDADLQDSSQRRSPAAKG